MPVEIGDIVRPDPKVLEAFRSFDSATVYEAAGRVGAMNSAIKPLSRDMRVVGPAFTVRCHPGDNLMIHLAVAIAQPGDVLVVDAGALTEAGYWGEVLTVAAMARHLGGLVIDGGVRDSTALIRRGFPVFARNICMRATNKVTPGWVNKPVCVGGVLVHPGDVIVGDGDGVTVVRRETAAAVVESARSRAQKEEQLMRRLVAGETTIDLLQLREVLREHGVANIPA